MSHLNDTGILSEEGTRGFILYGETMETLRDFFLGGGSKSLQMVIAAMKLKDACSLEENL